jgi:hypothetical protein
MRPALAIIRDSFREAAASRTLQALLALIVLILLVLAVPGIRIDLPSRFERDDFAHAEGLLAKLSRTPELQPPVTRLVRERLSEGTVQKLSEYRKRASAENARQAIESLQVDLNHIVEGGPIWDRRAWENVALSAEIHSLQRQNWEDLSREEQRRLNRLLMDAAWDGAAGIAPKARTYLTYVAGETVIALPGESIRGTVLSVAYLLIKWFVGAAGVLAAIIFTAAMIPQMFEPGAIDLLLSKPASRTSLFLAKFAGGCVFILISGSVFVVGLWLILGLRHEIWNPRLLWSIPLFLLAFAVYYSISAFVGVRWRNPILCIALTFVAWAGLSLLHQIWFWGQLFSLDGQRAEVLLPIDEQELIVVRKSGEAHRWRNGKWERVFEEDGVDPAAAMQRRTGLMYPLVGPVLSSDRRSLAAVEQFVMPELFTQTGKVVTGAADDDWRRNERASGPAEAKRVLAEPGGAFLIAGPAGLHRLRAPDAVQPGNEGESTLDPVGPPDISWRPPFDAAISREAGLIVIYSRGRLMTLRRGADDNYQVAAERRVESLAPAIVAAAGELAILARESGEIEGFDLETLKPRGSWGKIDAPPRRLIGSPSGKSFALVDHRRRLWLLSTDRPNVRAADVRGQKSITAAAFDPAGNLLVADRFPRVTSYSAEGHVLGVREDNNGFTNVFIYLINPLRMALPKPDELDFLVQRAVGASESEAPAFQEDLSRERGYVDYWTPLWTNVAFVAVVLAATCVYVSRKDF